MKEETGILIENYKESLKLTQRAIFFGLLISGISHYVEYTEGVSSLPKLPFLTVEFTSLETLQITLLILYLGSGFISWLAIKNAYANLEKINNPEISIAISHYPCLAVSGVWFRSLLAAALLSIGAMLLMSIYDFNTTYQKSLYFLAALPYWSTLWFGKEIKSWQKKNFRCTS